MCYNKSVETKGVMEMELNKLKEELDYMCSKGIIEDYSIVDEYVDAYLLKVFHKIEGKYFNLSVGFPCNNFIASRILEHVKSAMCGNYKQYLDQCLESEE